MLEYILKGFVIRRIVSGLNGLIIVVMVLIYIGIFRCWFLGGFSGNFYAFIRIRCFIRFGYFKLYELDIKVFKLCFRRIILLMFIVFFYFSMDLINCCLAIFGL